LSLQYLNVPYNRTPRFMPRSFETLSCQMIGHASSSIRTMNVATCPHSEAD
jgi:hypothetical protein